MVWTTSARYNLVFYFWLLFISLTWLLPRRNLPRGRGSRMASYRERAQVLQQPQNEDVHHLRCYAYDGRNLPAGVWSTKNRVLHELQKCHFFKIEKGENSFWNIEKLMSKISVWLFNISPCYTFNIVQKYDGVNWFSFWLTGVMECGAEATS